MADETVSTVVPEVKEAKKSDVIVKPIEAPITITIAEIEMFLRATVGITEDVHREFIRKAELLADSKNTKADKRHLQRQLNRLQVQISKLGTSFMAFQRALNKAAEEQRKAQVSIPK